MLFISAWRALKFAFQNFWRNIWLSIVTVLILVLTVFLVTTIAGTKVIADQAIASIRSRVDVAVYFKKDVAAERATVVENRLRELPEVKAVRYISSDEALDRFREKNKDNPTVLQALETLGENPLSASLIIEAEHIEDFPQILKVFDDPALGELVEDREQDLAASTLVIERLRSITDNIETAGIVLSIVFLAIAVLMVFNTIRITIYTYREEIGIMKLVGASNAFIRAPFVIESLLYAILACVVTMALFLPFLNGFAPFFDRFFEGYNIDLVGYFNQHFFRIFGMQLLAVSVLCMFSSSIAISRYLRV